MRKTGVALIISVALSLGLFEACAAGKSPCTAATCTGCCDTTGTCQTGNSNNACGSSGQTCASCSVGFNCFVGSCVVSGSGTGGGTSGTGGGTGGSGGGAATGGGTGGTGGGSTSCGDCSGCCAAGICIPVANQTRTNCGNSGNACQTCATTQTCASGICTTGAGGGAGGGTGGSGGGNTSGGEACDAETDPLCSLSNEHCVLLSGADTAGKCRTGCNTVTQTGCSPGQKCTYGSAGRQCVTAGSLTEGMGCTASGDQCAAGLLCIATSSGAQPKCVKFCDFADPSTCNANHSCSLGFQAVPSPDGEFQAVCGETSVSCNLLTQNCSPSTDSCLPVGGGGTGCQQTGTTAAGGSCAANSLACIKGAVCVNTGTPTCLKICNLDGGMPNCAGIGSGQCNLTQPALPQNAGICQ